MKKWDSLVEKLVEIDEARGLTRSTIQVKSKELYRWGIWLKQRRPKVKLEDINLELIHTYIKNRTRFVSKGSACGIIGYMRQMGDLFVEEGYWKQTLYAGYLALSLITLQERFLAFIAVQI